MGFDTRVALYKKVEEKRKRPLIVYVTSNRPNANGQIAGDSVPELHEQLQRLPAGTKAIDLLIVSDGGDPTVAWRIVSLIRERADEFSVLVPQAAFSAATLIVLGANEVVMHPNGNLGPTDPQIRVQRRSGKDGTTDAVGFGSEDLMAFLRFSKEHVGLKDPDHLLSVYSKFCDDVGTVGVGIAARSALLSVTMGEKLLRLHMTTDEERKLARSISEKLTKDYFHHGYPVNRTEAKEIGLKVAARDEEFEDLMWKIWSDLREELRIREPHNPVTVLSENPACQALFAAPPAIVVPPNLPPNLPQPIHQQVLALAQAQGASVPPAPFELIHALVESSRHASRFVTNGIVIGTKTPDQQIRVSTLNIRQGWKTVPAAAPVARGTVGALGAKGPKAPMPPKASVASKGRKPLKMAKKGAKKAKN